MIAAARQFEQQMKVLQGAEQREQGADQAARAAVARLLALPHTKPVGFASG